MKAKIGKIIGLIIAIGITFNINTAFGVQEPIMVQAALVTEVEEKNVLEVRLPIAVVNLDEGILQNEENVNYGTVLTKALNNVKTTSLEDAR